MPICWQSRSTEYISRSSGCVDSVSHCAGDGAMALAGNPRSSAEYGDTALESHVSPSLDAENALRFSTSREPATFTIARAKLRAAGVSDAGA